MEKVRLGLVLAAVVALWAIGGQALALEILEPGYHVEIYASYADPGAGNIYNIVFGDSGNLYVSHKHDQVIYKVSPYGQVSVFASGFGTMGIEWGAGTAYGNYLYVADGQINGQIRKIAPDGTVSGFASFGPPRHCLALAAIDRTGNYGGLFYTATAGQDHTYSVTTSGSISMFSDFPGWRNGGGPHDIAFDTTGNYGSLMYMGTGFNNSDGNEYMSGLFSLDSSGNATRFIPGVVHLGRVDFDVTGNFASKMYLLASENLGEKGSIWKVEPDGSYTYFAQSTATKICDLTFGPDGAMYVAEFLPEEAMVIISRIYVPDEPNIIHVDADAAQGGDGRTWETAFKFLQHGLAYAGYGDEIRVAQGVYTPETPLGQASNPNPPDGATDVSVDTDLSWTPGFGAISHDVYLGLVNPPAFLYNTTSTTIPLPSRLHLGLTCYWRVDEVGPSGKTPGPVWSFSTGQAPPPQPSQGLSMQPDSRMVTFFLKNGVTMKGGYAGLGEPDPNVRDIDRYESILSGDLNRDDVGGLHDPSRNDNSYHVVTGIGTDATAVLDGFTITGGNANGPYLKDRGAGILIYNSSPALTNCIFKNNSAQLVGGAMYVSSGNPMLENCNFSGNSADWGGGIYTVHGSPTITECTFIGNSASSRGGGIQNEYSDTTLTRCIFRANSARCGGAMSQDSGDVKVTNCTFSNNYADSGGAIINLQTLMLTNCTITGNSAIQGGGMFNDYGMPVINNCTFSDNSAELGGGIYCDYSEGSTLTNCILFKNAADYGPQIALRYSYNQSINYCNIQGGQTDVYVHSSTMDWGQGNIDADPCFVQTGLSGLISHWAFDEGGGTTAYDSVGSNHGTIQGPTWTAGLTGGALDFDGVDDYVEIPDDDSLNPTDELTISFWVNHRGYAGIYKIAYCPNESHSPGRSRSYFIVILSNTHQVVFRLHAAERIADSIYSNSTVPPNQWHHVTATFNRGKAEIYIDGQLDSSATLSISFVMNDVHSLFIGGCWSYCGADHWVSGLKGIMDEVAIFNRALSADEVRQLYESRVYGDYHVQPDSPCIDTGDNYSLPVDTTDLDGDGNTTEILPLDMDDNPRRWDGDGDGARVVDMGAYEAILYFESCFGVNHLKMAMKDVKCKGIALLEVTSDQGVFVYEPEPGKEKLKKDTTVDDGVNGPVKIHTSGSKPLEIGDVFGPYTITNLVKILDEKQHRKADNVDIKCTFRPSAPVDLTVDDVTFIIDDGEGNVLDLFIPAGSFEPEGRPEHQKYRFHSPKKTKPDIKARFDFLKCKFELQVKKAENNNEITGTSLGVALYVGNNIGEQVLEVEPRKKHLEYRRKPKLDCCRE